MMKQEKVEAIRANEEIGVKLMNAWEEKIYDREDGRQEGLKEGIEKGFSDAQEQLILKMKRKLSDEEIADLTDIPLEKVKAISSK